MVLLKIKGNKPFGPYACTGDAESLNKTWRAAMVSRDVLEHGERLSNLGWRMYHMRANMVPPTEDDDARRPGRKEFARCARVTVDALERSKARPVHSLTLPEFSAEVGRKLKERAEKRAAERHRAARARPRSRQPSSAATPSSSAAATPTSYDLKGKGRASSEISSQPLRRLAGASSRPPEQRLWHTVPAPSYVNIAEETGAVSEPAWSIESIEAAERELAAQGVDLEAPSLAILADMKRAELARQCAARNAAFARRQGGSRDAASSSTSMDMQPQQRFADAASAGQGPDGLSPLTFAPPFAMPFSAPQTQQQQQQQQQPALQSALLAFLTQALMAFQAGQVPPQLAHLFAQAQQGVSAGPQGQQAQHPPPPPPPDAERMHPQSPFTHFQGPHRPSMDLTPSYEQPMQNAAPMQDPFGMHHSATHASFFGPETPQQQAVRPPLHAAHSFDGPLLPSAFEQQAPQHHMAQQHQPHMAPSMVSSLSMPGTPQSFAGTGGPFAFGSSPAESSRTRTKTSGSAAGSPMTFGASTSTTIDDSKPSTPAAGSVKEDRSKPECSNCGATSTPLWRRDSNLALQCNACGLYLKLHKVPRPRELKQKRAERVAKQAANAAAAANTPNAGGGGEGSSSAARSGPTSGTASGSTTGEAADSDEWVGIHAGASCANCGTSTTPLWRKDPDGRIICNACGLYYKLHSAHRPVAMRADVIRKRARYDSRAPQPSPAPSAPSDQQMGPPRQPPMAAPAMSAMPSGLTGQPGSPFGDTKMHELATQHDPTIFLPPELLDSQACPMGAWGEACCQNLPMAQAAALAVSSPASASLAAAAPNTAGSLGAASSPSPNALTEALRQLLAGAATSGPRSGPGAQQDWAAALGLGPMFDGPALDPDQAQAQAFAQAQAQQQQQQQQQQLDKRLGPSLAPRIAAIHKAWNTQDLQSCRFLAYLYTSLPASLIAQFGPQGAGGAGPLSQYPNLGRRADAVGPRHEALWAQAVRENPDPERLVPALAVGFSDLKSRSEQQASEAARQLARLGELRTRLSALEQAHALRNSSRAAAAARRQVALHQRLVAHARRAHLLIPALRGASVGADEERLREKLERCEAELEAQGAGVGQGRLRARVNELWAVLGALKAKREMGKGREEWAVVDDAAIEDVAKILASQQQGLNHLSSTLEADTRALDTIVRGLQGVQLVGVKGEGAGDR